MSAGREGGSGAALPVPFLGSGGCLRRAGGPQPPPAARRGPSAGSPVPSHGSGLLPCVPVLSRPVAPGEEGLSPLRAPLPLRRPLLPTGLHRVPSCFSSSSCPVSRLGAGQSCRVPPGMVCFYVPFSPLGCNFSSRSLTLNYPIIQMLKLGTACFK